MEAFDALVIRFLEGDIPDLSSVDPVEFLAFACREAYYHIEGRDPTIPDKEKSGKDRCASFVRAAILCAIKRAGKAAP